MSKSSGAVTPRTPKAPHEVVRALLAKTQAAGCTPGEEATAVEKALQRIKKEGLDIGDFVFPAGYGRDGLPVPPEPAAAPKRTRIIKVAAETLLLEITGTNADGHTTGHSYEEILRRVKLEFPTGNTSIKCLRWYATHMKDQGMRLPQKRDRPVPKPKAA